MPIVQVNTNKDLNEIETSKLLREVSLEVSKILGKPYDDVMVIFSHCDMMMANNNSPAVFIDLRVISGLTKEKANDLSNRLGEIFQKALELDLNRMYINFFDIPAEHAWRFKNEKATCPPLKK